MESSQFTSAAFDRAVEPVFSILSKDQAVQIADFHGDEALQSRIEELASMANEGSLSTDEQAEYQGYSQANQFLAIMQAKARRLVDSSGENG